MPQLHVSHGGTPGPKMQDIFLYKAVIRLQVESSSVAFNPAFDRYAIRSRLEVPLGIKRPHKWPPLLSNDPEKDIHILALAKVKLMLDLGTTLPDAHPTQMRKATHKQFLKIEPELQTTSQLDTYARIFIEAGVNEDGEPHHTSTVEGILPPGLTGEVVPESEDQNTDFELFWKNLVRADILERIEALR
jgi:hypothetical protein